MCNSLEAMLQVKKGKENAVIKKINKNRQSFPKIRKVEKYNDNKGYKESVQAHPVRHMDAWRDKTGSV